MWQDLNSSLYLFFLISDLSVCRKRKGVCGLNSRLDLMKSVWVKFLLIPPFILQFLSLSTRKDVWPRIQVCFDPMKLIYVWVLISHTCFLFTITLYIAKNVLMSLVTYKTSVTSFPFVSTERERERWHKYHQWSDTEKRVLVSMEKQNTMKGLLVFYSS